jgi:hypothetical protein
MLDRRASSSLRLDRGLLKRLHAVLALSTIAVWTWPARAATVAIVSPPILSAEVMEALNLLRGELLSVGLDVAMEHRPADRDQRGPDSRRWLEDLAAGGASAVVDTVEVDAGLAVDVWVVKTNPLRFEVTRVAVDPDMPKASEVLALRAVEALRAGLLLIDRAARRQRQEAITRTPPIGAPLSTEDGLAEPRERLGLDVGAAALASLDGVGVAILPMVRMSWAVRSSLLAQASLAGAGTRPRVTTAGGTARVAQQYGTLGACYRLRFRERLWPFFALAAGGIHTSAEGQADAVTQGRTVAQWSFLLDGSLGAGLRIYHPYYMTLAAHVQWVEPYVAIHIADAVGATTGRPNLVLTLTVGAWL